MSKISADEYFSLRFTNYMSELESRLQSRDRHIQGRDDRLLDRTLNMVIKNETIIDEPRHPEKDKLRLAKKTEKMRLQ